MHTLLLHAYRICSRAHRLFRFRFAQHMHTLMQAQKHTHTNIHTNKHARSPNIDLYTWYYLSIYTVMRLVPGLTCMWVFKSRATERLDSSLRRQNKSHATKRPKLCYAGFSQNSKSSPRGFLSPTLPSILKTSFTSQVLLYNTFQAPLCEYSMATQKPASRVFKFRATARLKLHFAGFP